MLSRLTFALCLLATACTTSSGGERVDGAKVQSEVCATGCSAGVEQALASPTTRWEQLDDQVFVSSDDASIEVDACTLLPTEGMCAYACDPDEFKKHIPAGSCLDVRCELRDGRQIVVGACATP